MDEAEKDRIQHELEDEANTLFPGVVRSIVLLQHGEDPLVEPGEVLVRAVIAEPADERPEPRVAKGPLSRFRGADGEPAIRQFTRELAQRLPAVRRIEVVDEGDEHHRRLIRVADDQAGKADGSVTPVMVRLRPAELEIVDTLIKAGIAPNRAEAVRWALARIGERPAYQQLREHAGKIEQLKTQF
jgi:hypothetical protein